MKKCTAFVLGGGGSRGALQVGALRALLEAGITPDLIVGTSIGAGNAAGLGFFGADLNGLDQLEQVWEKVSSGQMLDPKVSQLILRVLMRRPSESSRKNVESYLISLGITPELTFRKLAFPHIGLVSADLENGEALLYGHDPDDSVLEGVMTSIAVPPWFMPIQKVDQIIMDGGALSTLPIEPALRMGATEIIALNLNDTTLIPKENPTVFELCQKYLSAADRRHILLETQIAESKGVHVRRIDFAGLAKTPIWDFSDYRSLRQAGYEKTKKAMVEWNRKHQRSPAFSLKTIKQLFVQD